MSQCPVCNNFWCWNCYQNHEDDELERDGPCPDCAMEARVMEVLDDDEE